MTDTRKEFEEWWLNEKLKPWDYPDAPMPKGWGDHYKPTAAKAWQAYQQLNDKRIADLLAVIELQKTAMQKLYDTQNGCPLPKYEHDWNEAMQLTQEALAINPDSVELVEVGKVKEVAGVLFASSYTSDGHAKVGDSVYTIKTKAKTCPST